MILLSEEASAKVMELLEKLEFTVTALIRTALLSTLFHPLRSCFFGSKKDVSWFNKEVTTRLL